MPTNVLRLPGDYVIEAKNGNMTINVTNTTTTGTVTVIGNLDVIGTTTQIETVDSFIKDNVIVLNAGETNEYVSRGSGGIIIDRGHSANPYYAATIIFDDEATWTSESTTYRGVWELMAGQDGYPTGSALKVNGIRIDVETTSTLNILGSDNPYSTINVKGTIDYEDRVVNDDDIPNKKYVDDAITGGTYQAKKIQAGFTSVKAFSPLEVIPEFYYADDKVEAALGTSTNVVFRLEGTAAQIQGLTINNSTIEVNGTGTDIVLQPLSSYSVSVEGSLKLQTTTTPVAAANRVFLYSDGTVGGGGTGLRFVNTSVSDELVSRRRAIIYGIIF